MKKQKKNSLCKEFTKGIIKQNPVLRLVLGRIRRAKIQIEDSIFWFVFSGFLLLLSIFPELAYWAANTLGMQAPINVVYLAIIFLLILKVFFMSLRISQMDSKMKILAQKVALNEEKIERAHQDR